MARRRRRPARGSPPPLPDWDALYPTLDLHGDTAEAARRRATRWLEERQAEGIRVVRLVTGRGRHSVGPPVLRGEIEDLLRSLRASVVATVTLEHGGGSFRVELRRRARVARPPAASRSAGPAVDADLRREAEEALADLGVTPTPALLEVELRRLLRERGGGGS